MKTTQTTNPVPDSIASGFTTALLGAVLSFGLYCLCLGGMFSNVDSRLILTMTDTFSGLAEIRDVFNGTTSYLAAYNPPGLDHVPFPPGPETREELEDLVRRGLVPGDALSRFQSVDSNSDPSLLHRVMVSSWCSSGRAIPNVLPAGRTPGCACIADAYLDMIKSTRLPNLTDFTAVGYKLMGGYNTTVLEGGVNQTILVGGVNQTILVNGTNKTVLVGGVNTTVLVGAVNTTVWIGWTNQTIWGPTVVQVPVDVRARVSSKVYRCWDMRQVRRSRACGEACKTHLLGLPLFANIVLFLVCMSYLAFVQMPRNNWNLYIVKLIIVVLGVVLCIPFYVRYAESNALNFVGVVVCLFYIVVSLHGELDVNKPKVSPEVNPLSVCFLVNLPLILSAHAIQLSVSGYGRDLWASLSFGSCGGLLGVLLQRYFWVCRYWVVPASGSAEHGFQLVARIALSWAFVCVQFLFLLLFLAYRNDGSPYGGAAWPVQVFYQGFLWLLAFLYQRDAEDRAKYNSEFGLFTFTQSAAVFAVVLANVGMTIMAVVDVATHPG